jgi:methylase of polypeptide subunit release factors
MLTPLNANPKPLFDFFREAGFTHEQFKENPALRELPSRRLGNLQDLLERTSEPTAQHILLRWFFLGTALESATVPEVIPAPMVTLMLETGLLVREGDRLAPTVMLTPCDGFLFAADRASTLESPESSGMVLWPNPSTRLLQMFTIRRPSEATLDLGAGCGILAVLASGHSRQVVATDLNPRATEFARFNVWLNGVPNVECLTGDTFEPVQGRTFDLITSNPPFFVTPSTGQIYCENSMELDGYCRELVRAAPRHLNENGFLQITFEWVKVTGQSWQDRLKEWLEDSGCDAWVLRSYARTAAAYASERIGGIMPYSPLAANQRFDEWMAYYRARGVEEIQGGILAMRRRSGKNWIRIEEVSNLDFREAFGDSVVDLFVNQDRLETDRSLEQMMAWKPRLPPDARIDQQLHLEAGEWRPSSMQLRRPGGLPSSLALDPLVVDFLRKCDGSRTLGELARDLAAAVKIDPEQVCQQCCAVTRKLVEHRLALL